MRWRLLLWYGNCVAAIALLGLLVAISNSASTLSCSSSGLISPEIAGHIGKATFSQAGWWLLFLVGSITGNWGAIPWQKVSLPNLTALKGRQLRITLTAADCTQTGHGGYLYMDNVTCD